jgi:proteic killer suppression protein
MDIKFTDKKLEKLANNDRKMLKELGKVRAEKFRLRLFQLHNAQNLEEIRHLPGRFHELIGNRKGQWACDLDQPYRLIFEPQEKPIPTDPNGRFIWFEIKGVEIIEIDNYHKER